MWHHIFLEYSTHFFEQPRSYNDTNMLERSFVFIELVDGCTPLINYSINGNNYTILEGGGGWGEGTIYPIDGIYHLWETFVKTSPPL